MPTKAEPTLTPHEDPSITKSTLDAYSFLEEYAAIFALMANQQFKNASQISEKLSHMTVPQELSYIINRYNNITQQLITTLNDLQTTLDTTASLLDQNRLNEAEQTLDHAGVLVAKAQILINDLKDATATLSQRMGVFATAAGSRTQQAYNQLQSMIEKLSALIERYYSLLQQAIQRAEEIKTQNLDATTLTLALDRTKCYVGDTITVSGKLTSKGTTLGNREIKLFIDKTQVATTKTSSNGNYYTTIKVPYKYVDSIRVNTTYSPEGNDKNRYLAALSPTITLQLIFYKTSLEISSPDVAYPGLPLTITGKVTDPNGTALTERKVNILIDDTKETQVKTDKNGTFTTKFTINTQITLGKHILTVTVDPQGSYASATRQKTITMQKMATYLQVNAPTFILLPAQIEITGTASAESTPLKEATIKVEYANITAAIKTQDDGSFNLTIDVPLNTALASNQELIVKVQPNQPWQATAQTTKNIFTLNTISTSIALASSFSIFAVAYIRFTKNKKTKKVPLKTKTITALSAPIENNLASIQPITNETNFNGTRGKILKTYTEALAAVQTFTNNPLTKTMTLREYAQLTQLKIGNTATEFRELTALAEKSLYSPHEPQPQEIEKAENLSKTVRRNLTASA